MPPKAPRLPIRLWRCWARGALLALSVWLTGLVPLATAETIKGARFTEPTTRYAHGVLGDSVEYGGLHLTVNGQDVTIRLSADRVFEDITPRLIDVDRDGKPEVVVVETHAEKGAQLAIYNALGEKVAATPHIGTRFRWLAPIGAADLDGDGHIEIAYIDRPHLAKTLRIWRFEDGALTEIASMPGLTNHRIGEDYITGGIRDCGAGPELIVVSADWQEVIAVQYAANWKQDRLSSFSPDAVDRALSCAS